MADIRPFPGIRPRADVVKQLAAPPYDVINSREARQMAEGNPLSFLHISKAEIDFGPEVDVHGVEVYKKGAENLQRFMNQGILVQDPAPCFYIYEVTMGDHTQRGLVMGASVDEYEDNRIKKHEHTRRDKEDDRACHVDTLNANTGPVLLTHRASEAVDGLLEARCRDTAPAYDFVADDAVRHALWVISEPDQVATIQQRMAAIDAMYVADGHHRSAAAFRVRDIRKKKNPHHTGDEPYNHFLAVTFPDNQLQILGYYRAVKDLNDLTPEAFLARLAEDFEVAPATDPEPRQPRHFTMLLDDQWYSLTARPGSFAENDPVQSLDVSILQRNVLEPILDLHDLRTNTRIDFIGGIRGTRELERRCREDMRVAFALYPTRVEQLMRVADQGEIMPPKSTWFEPKLRSGLVVRSL